MPIKEEVAKSIIETLLSLQENPDKAPLLPCPRCGEHRMHREVVLNCLSRRANVYVCTACGEEEAIIDANSHLVRDRDFAEWAMIAGFRPIKRGGRALHGAISQ
jgi:predicted RNA-binding Zn-ribbon protein involved in translation (DUF1610 family)